MMHSTRISREWKHDVSYILWKKEERRERGRVKGKNEKRKNFISLRLNRIDKLSTKE